MCVVCVCVSLSLLSLSLSLSPLSLSLSFRCQPYRISHGDCLSTRIRASRRPTFFSFFFTLSEVIQQSARIGWWWSWSWWLSIYMRRKTPCTACSWRRRGVEALKPAADGRYLMCKSLPCYFSLLYRSTFNLLNAKYAGSQPSRFTVAFNPGPWNTLY